MAHSERRPAAGLSVGRILVVDDNADATRIMRIMLELQGHSVRVLNDSSAVLEETKAFDPHVVLLDIGMPGMDGYEVARRLRAETGDPRPLLIAVTGYGRDDDVRRSLDAGFDRHLVKPVKRELLQQLIAERLGR